MGPSHPYRSLPLDLPLMLEGGDPQWFSFLQNPFPITLVLDGLATLQMVRTPFLPKLCPKPLSCPKQATTTSTTPLVGTQPLKEVEFSLCPHSFDCPMFQILLKAKEGATVFAGGPPSVNWRQVPESYSRANEAPALGTAFPPPIIHRTAPRALTTPSCSFVQQTR